VTILNASQLAAVAGVREKAWTQDFEILTYQQAAQHVDNDDPTPDTYDVYAEPAAPTTIAAKGDWVWAAQQEGIPREGGVALKADLTLNCSIDYQAALFAEGSRVRVDGFECAITKVTSFPDSKEIELLGTRVKT
jgi:hypothetical protein